MADFRDVDVRKPCGLTAKELQSRITPKLAGNEVTYKIPQGGSKMRDIAGLMLKMEVEYGVSATFLCALMAWETGWGCNNYAYNYNSFFSYMAYDHNPDGTIKNGGKTVEEGLRNGVRAVVGDFVVNKKCYTPRLFKAATYATSNAWLDGVASVWAGLQGENQVGSTPATATTGGGRSTSEWVSLVGRQWDWATFRIEKGDSVQSIATMFKQTQAWVVKWNGLKSGQVLNPGWYVRVYPFYETQTGDTMDAILKDFGVTKAEIQKLNPSFSTLKPGIKLRLPNTVINDTPPTSYDQINRDTPSLQDRYKRELPLQPIVGVPPKVEDDEYPAHRTRQNPFAVRIGDVQLFIPPTSIRTKKDGYVDSKNIIRTQNAMMTRSGYTKRIIELELIFADTDQINGYQVKGPMGKTYYMDGLRPLIAQFMKNPFLPIRNELLNERLHVYNVAFQDLTVETDDEFDNVLIATLKLVECTLEPFTQYPDFYYDNMIMYPLFRWWYQQVLLDSESDRLSARHLAPVPAGSMRNDIKFQVLDRELIEQVVGETNPYALSQMKIPDLSSLMTDWDIGGAILTRVIVGISKDLKPIYTDHNEMPAFQDLGGINREFLLEFICTNRAQMESLNNMVSHLEDMSRDYRQKFVSGYLGVRNDIVNLIGVYNAMVVSLETETMNENDEEYIVRLFCRGFDATQKNNERVMGINSTMENIEPMFSFSNDPTVLIEDKNLRSNGTMYEAAIEESLNTLELYPDLELPTYSDLNTAINAINKFRRQYGRSTLPMSQIERPPQSIFVDPDFYMAYPDIKRAFDDLTTGEFGQRVVNLLNGMDSYQDYVMASNQMDLGWWLDGVDADLVAGWATDTFKKTQKEKSTASVNIDSAIYEHAMPVAQHWSENNRIPQGNDMLQMMCHDMKLYNRKGRLVRAFPTYLMVMVDEGQWLNGKRLWNNYYTYHAIQELSVVKDKNTPVDLAYIRMTNIYGSFDFSSRMSDPRQFMSKSTGILDRVKKLFTNFFLTIDEKMITERTQMIDQIKMRQGARIHLRMGYGATASYLPIAFNGQVATINEGDELELVCQGDGVELTNLVSMSIDSKLLDGKDLAEEPQDMFRQILCTRESDFWFAVAGTSINKNYTSKFGIEHFGYLESLSDSGWGSFVDLGNFVADKFMGWIGSNAKTLTRNEYDIMKNIYRGTVWEAFTDDEWILDGELNLVVNPYNRTTWDVFQTITLHTPEFICGVHPHGFRSTLFHGMPHWPVKYGYRRKKDATGKAVGKATDITSYEELYKTYQQFHVFASGYDIVHNNIQTSSEQIKHIGVGVYTKSRGADTTTTWPVYADRTIKAEVQKTIMVDTMVHQNLFGPEWAYDFARSTFGWVNDLLVWAGKMGGEAGVDLALKLDKSLTPEQKTAFKKEWYARVNKQVEEDLDKDFWFTPGQRQALAVVIGTLQRQMMEMYQGELVLLGNPSVKPWDIFFLSDEYTMMNGTAGVGKVTHTLGLSTGFMTIIKPDLCVTRSDGVQMNELLTLLQRLGVQVAGIGAKRLAMTKAAKMLAKVAGASGLWGVRNAGKVGMFAAKMTVGENAVRLAGQALGQGKNIIKGVTSLKSFGSLGGKALKLVKTNFVLSILLGWIATKAEDYEKKEFGYNNVLFIYPLWKTNRAYVAGISGFRHIIPGYVEPDWLPLDDIKRIDTSNPSNVNPNKTPTLPSSTGGGAATTPAGSQYYGNLAAGSTVPPVSKLRITSRFGPRASNKNIFHRGVDIGPLERGKFTTPVVSIADGIITNIVKWSGDMNAEPAGNHVEVQYKIDGVDYHVTYMHMNVIYADTVGVEVKAGDHLGMMGNTGRIYKVKPGDIDAAGRAAGEGMHLHFEIEESTKRNRSTTKYLLDPEKFFKKMGWTTT